MSELKKIKLAIIGYGNIGKGCELALSQNEDLELIGIYTRRQPKEIQVQLEENKHKVFNVENIQKQINKIDVGLLCGGSAKDLPVQGPKFAQSFCTVDSYDNHKNILEYKKDMNLASSGGSNLSIISVGWDPGIFSYERLLAQIFIKDCQVRGFYGLGEKGGLSMGHSDALRRIEGVKDARQYTHAKIDAIEKVRSGENPNLSQREMHWRECFVVLELGADRKRIEDSIRTMKGYFKPYDVKIHFTTEEGLKKVSSDRGQCHDGLVIASGKTVGGYSSTIEYRCSWESNPEATASVMVAYARACYQLNKEGRIGALSPIDIPPVYLSEDSFEEMLKKNLI